MKAQIAKADISEARPVLDSLDGKLVVNAGFVLNLFEWQKQIQACQRLVQLLKVGIMVLMLPKPAVPMRWKWKNKMRG